MSWRYEYASDILYEAGINNLDPLLIKGVIQVESGGNPWAFRHEPRWKYWVHWDSGVPYKGSLLSLPSPPGVSRASERALQGSSFGLMQIMGSVARENGFTEKFLTKLLLPRVNLQWGCKFLKKCLDQRNGDVERGLVRWNGSSDYPPKVFKAMEEIEP
jgi:hypothetical protein